MHHLDDLNPIEPFGFTEAFQPHMDDAGSLWFNLQAVSAALGLPADMDNAAASWTEQLPGDLRNGSVREIKGNLYIPAATAFRLAMRAPTPMAVRLQLWLAGSILPILFKDGVYAEQEEEVPGADNFAKADYLFAKARQLHTKAEAFLDRAKHFATAA